MHKMLLSFILEGALPEKFCDTPLSEDVLMIPTGKSAVKTSNHLKKNFEAVRLRSFSSNPYVDWQALLHRIPAEHGDRLRSQLEAEGWKFDNSSINTADYVKAKTGHYTHEDGGHILIGRLQGKFRRKGQPVTDSVTVYGDKKAKPTTIPYYD